MKSVLVAVCVMLGGISIITGRKYNQKYGLLPRNCELNDRRPNLLDRHTFYWCLVDGPVLMKCSPGLSYNATAGRCTKHNDLVTSIVPSLVEQKDPVPLQKESETDAESSEGKPRCPQQKTPPWGVRCPAIDPTKYSIYFPDPLDCNCFYQCDNGVAKRRPCRKDLHFNATTNLCDWPEEAGCYLRNKLRW